MSGFETVIVVIVALAAGLYALLGVAIVVTHLIEKRPVRYLVRVPEGDPERARFEALLGAGPRREEPGEPSFNPYEAPGSAGFFETMNRGAAGLGFRPCGVFTHVKGGTYRVHAALWVSPSRQTLAVIMWGTLARIKADKALLYSLLDDGRVLVTTDSLGAPKAPGFYLPLSLPKADFDRLVRRHEERLEEFGGGARPFRPEAALEDYEALLARASEFRVALGEAYFTDPGRSAIRSTLKGALLAYARTFQAQKYVEKVGEAGAPPQAKESSLPLALEWVERACYIALAVCAFLSLRGQGRPANRAQIYFRVAVVGTCLFGIVVIAVIKAVLKRRSRS